MFDESFAAMAHKYGHAGMKAGLIQSNRIDQTQCGAFHNDSLVMESFHTHFPPSHSIHPHVCQDRAQQHEDISRTM